MRSSNLLRQETERRTELTFSEPMWVQCAMSRAEVYGGRDAPHRLEAGQVGTPSLVPANCGHGAGTTPATTGPWATTSASVSTHQVPGNKRMVSGYFSYFFISWC